LRGLKWKAAITTLSSSSKNAGMAETGMVGSAEGYVGTERGGNADGGGTAETERGENAETVMTGRGGNADEGGTVWTERGENVETKEKYRDRV